MQVRTIVCVFGVTLLLLAGWVWCCETNRYSIVVPPSQKVWAAGFVLDRRTGTVCRFQTHADPGVWEFRGVVADDQVE